MIDRRTLLAATGLLPSVLSGAVRAQAPVAIKIGWAITPAQLPPIIFANPGILKHYGRSYTVELVYFRGSAPQITALAAGELQIAALAFSSFALAIQNARMTDLRAIGDLYQDGVPGYYSSQYVVRADSPVHSVADLKGKLIATNGLGGAIDMATRKRLRDEHMEDKRDYNVIEVQFPNMPAMLSEGKVAMAGMVAPFSLEEVGHGRARPLFTIADAMGVTQTTLLAARAAFIERNRAALVDLMEDLQIGTRWLLDPANRDAALQIVARVTKQPVSDFSEWAFTPNDYFRDKAVRPNLEALQNNIRVQKELGFLRADVDVPRYADLSMVEEAAKR
ncbi:MAG: ABC transporter substrate-binding protein [Acetobacteraceae bacterium]